MYESSKDNDDNGKIIYDALSVQMYFTSHYNVNEQKQTLTVIKTFIQSYEWKNINSSLKCWYAYSSYGSCTSL